MSDSEEKKELMTAEMYGRIVKDGIQTWLNSHSEEQITQRTCQFLSKYADNIVPALIGMDHIWGRWEFKKDSNLQARLNTIQKEAINEWFDKLNFNAALKCIDVQAMQRKFEKDFTNAFERELYNKAKSMGTAEAERYIATFSATTVLEKEFKLENLLDS